MGGGPSKPEETPDVPELSTILEENTYTAGEDSKYPYFLIQLNDEAELPYKGALVSDAIVEYIRDNDVTHIIAQTHGWNTPPNKAVAVPFTEFIAGMQNDRAMPQQDFNPIFVAFIWQAVPLSFVRAEDALTRAQLLAQEEKEQAGGETDISKAAEVAKIAIEEGDPDKEELVNEFKTLAAHSHLESDDEEDEDDDTKVDRIRREGRVEKDDDTLGERVVDFGLSILNPLQNLVFGRLMSRGQKTGKVMERVLGKLMRANEGVKTKVCLMANSLGAHVLAGILKDPQHIPHKIHTVFYVQGAITDSLFRPGAKFEKIREHVAGPIVCTFSDRDLLLKNIFGAFHGEALGLIGAPIGDLHEMKSLDECQENPYRFHCGDWNSVDGTKYIDEGNAVAGGHGDFKEDETTTCYWSAIKTFVDPDAYDR